MGKNEIQNKKSKIENIISNEIQKESKLIKEIDSFEDDIYSKLLQQLEVKISEVINKIIEEKLKYYDDYPPINQKDLKVLIRKMSLKNGSISATANLAPGPAGLLTMIGEVGYILYNQFGLVTDIAVAYGKKEELDNRDFLLKSFLLCIGVSHIGANIAAKKLIPILSKKIAAKSASQATSKFANYIPGVFSVAFGSWAAYETIQIGSKAVEIFSGVNDQSNNFSLIDFEPKKETYEVTLEKIKILSNLMKVNGDLDTNQINYIINIIENVDVKKKDFNEIIKSFKNDYEFEIDYKKFLKDQKYPIQTLIDLVSIAKVDGKFSKIEKDYIIKIGDNLGVDQEIVIQISENN